MEEGSRKEGEGEERGKRGKRSREEIIKTYSTFFEEILYLSDYISLRAQKDIMLRTCGVEPFFLHLSYLCLPTLYPADGLEAGFFVYSFDVGDVAGRFFISEGGKNLPCLLITDAGTADFTFAVEEENEDKNKPGRGSGRNKKNQKKNSGGEVKGKKGRKGGRIKRMLRGMKVDGRLRGENFEITAGDFFFVSPHREFLLIFTSDILPLKFVYVDERSERKVFLSRTSLLAVFRREGDVKEVEKFLGVGGKKVEVIKPKKVYLIHNCGHFEAVFRGREEKHLRGTVTGLPETFFWGTGEGKNKLKPILSKKVYYLSPCAIILSPKAGSFIFSLRKIITIPTEK